MAAGLRQSRDFGQEYTQAASPGIFSCCGGRKPDPDVEEAIKLGIPSYHSSSRTCAGLDISQNETLLAWRKESVLSRLGSSTDLGKRIDLCFNKLATVTLESHPKDAAKLHIQLRENGSITLSRLQELLTVYAAENKLDLGIQPEQKEFVHWAKIATKALFHDGVDPTINIYTVAVVNSMDTNGMQTLELLEGACRIQVPHLRTLIHADSHPEGHSSRQIQGSPHGDP